MRKSKKSFETDWAKFDTHKITPEEYEELPEWTDEMFDKAVLHYNGKPMRGRPKKMFPKVRTAIRLDADIVSTFRSTGKGWQTTINNALREWLTQNPGMR